MELMVKEVKKKDYWGARCDECDRWVDEGKVYYIRAGRTNITICEDCYKKFKKMIDEEKDITNLVSDYERKK